MPSHDDIYVSSSRRFAASACAPATRSPARSAPPKDQEKYCGLLRVDTVNGVDPEVAKRRPVLRHTWSPIFPDEMFDLETDQKNLTQRLINLIAPIGKGQRGLIVSPPKAGKTTLLKHIAARHHGRTTRTRT